MIFYMILCPEQAQVIELIQANGGIFSDVYSASCHELVPYEMNFMLRQEFDHPVYSYKFVHDSVALNCIQSLALYELSVIQAIESHKNTKFSYSEFENEQMKKFVKENNGNPNNISFWKDAKIKINFNHSADSLRAHWKILCNKGFNKKIFKPFGDNIYKKNLKNCVGDDEKIMNEVSKRENYAERKIVCMDNNENNMDLDEMFIYDNKYQCKDYEGYPRKRKSGCSYRSSIKTKQNFQEEINESGINELFINLVDICRHVSRKSLDPSYVAEVLINKKGVVKETLEFFK